MRGSVIGYGKSVRLVADSLQSFKAIIPVRQNNRLVIVYSIYLFFAFGKRNKVYIATLFVENRFYARKLSLAAVDYNKIRARKFFFFVAAEFFKAAF